MAEQRYPVEKLAEDDDDGTMPDNVAELEQAVIGHRIVSAEIEEAPPTEKYYLREHRSMVLALDNGTRVRLVGTDDCCAFTDIEGFLLHPDKIDHAITGVGTTDEYTKWHIYADFGDVVELDVGWSCGNPFYYGYGFDIAVEPLAPALDKMEANDGS